MFRISLICFALLVSFISAPASARIAGAPSDRWEEFVLNPATTEALVSVLQAEFKKCVSLVKVYRYDCYRKSYRDAAVSLRGSKEYRPAYEAMRLVESRINAVIKENRDTDKPRLQQGLRRYSAVKKDALPTLKKATIKAMEDAQTVLLRAPSNKQQAHFQRIAATINTNKLLLRSALLDLYQHLPIPGHHIPSMLARAAAIMDRPVNLIVRL